VGLHRETTVIADLVLRLVVEVPQDTHMAEDHDLLVGPIHDHLLHDADLERHLRQENAVDPLAHVVVEAAPEETIALEVPAQRNIDRKTAKRSTILWIKKRTLLKIVEEILFCQESGILGYYI